MKPKAIVVLDPGHGGNDPGAIGSTGIKEKEIALQIAQRIPVYLSVGTSVIFTRASDKTVELYERTKLANAMNADCLVSIHCNAANNPMAHGTETFAYKLGSNGERLARLIQQEMVTLTGLTDRGVKTANLHMLRETIMPAALVEVAFISNPTEEAWLANTTNQELASKAIAKAICQYLGVPWINEWEEQRKAALQKLAVKAGFNTSHETTELVDMGLLAVVLERLGVI